ncbi:MAG: trypsin-like peptidase domain-containing protein [Verrucomicrobiota bacterium]|nr:trypsin-like peptidase domain-containing protein [Verrucomicrobiota bacterium]
MRRIGILIGSFVFVTGTVFAQPNTPPPPPGEGMPAPTAVKEPPPAAPIIVAGPRQPNGKIQKSLVRITSTEVEPDYRAPWNTGAIGRGVGAGFVIDGKRILTNAHVVSNTRYLTVERDGDPNKYPARVLFVAHDCDLALITVDSPDFYKEMVPLRFGDIPELESTVSAYGYPIGGERMSVTAGIVSRIDFQLYTHSSIDSHLAIQISAQINPGNSGGPVMQNTKVVGVAFQGYSGDVAQGVAYMIPTPVIRRFLKDIEDGHYDKYVDLGITYMKLQNPAMRRYLGLPNDGRGVMATTVIEAGSCGKVLESGDVLLSIDDHPIASDGQVNLDGEHVDMPEVVERKFKGDKVKFDILRQHKPLAVTVELKTVWPYLVQGHYYDMKPRYIVFGGLLFQPMSLDLIEAYQISDLRIRHFFDYYVLEQIYLQHPDVIVLTNILPDPTNTYLMPYRLSIVDEVNGKKIGTLSDLAKAFAEPGGDQIVVKMIGDAPPLVLDRKEVESASDRIRTRYNVLHDENLGDESARTPVPAATP